MKGELSSFIIYISSVVLLYLVLISFFVASYIIAEAGSIPIRSHGLPQDCRHSLILQTGYDLEGGTSQCSHSASNNKEPQEDPYCIISPHDYHFASHLLSFIYIFTSPIITILDYTSLINLPVIAINHLDIDVERRGTVQVL